MKKRLLMLWIFLLCVVGGMSAEEVVIDFSAQGYTETTDMTTQPFVKDGITLTFDKGTGTKPQYYVSGTAVRMYASNKLTVSSEKNIIVGVAITFGSSDGTNEITVDGGTYTDGTWSGKAADVTFTIGGTKGNRRIQKLTITTEVPVVSAPTITGESLFFGSTAITLACATEGASIYYTTDETEPSATNGTLYRGTPFSIEATTTVKAIAVKDADASLVASKTFVARKGVANIAELNALEKGDVFAFTGDAVVVAKPEGDTRYLYIKDATGSSLIYNGNYAALAEGNHITPNWFGTVDIYSGLFEAIPQSDLTAVEGKQDKIAYDIVDLDAITAENVNRIVKIKGVTYTVPDAKKNFTITKGDATVAGYNRFVSEIAEPSTVDTYNMVGAISVYATNTATTYQFMPISIETAPRPIVINAETGADITALVNAEKEAVTTSGVKVGDITINLAAGGAYTVIGTIEAPAGLVINGDAASPATIDASALAAPFVAMSATPSVDVINDYYRVDQIKIANVKINGIKNSIFYDNNTKYCVVDFTIDNSVLALATEAVENEALVSFKGGGAKDVNITNSTFYGNNSVAKYFIRYNNSARLDRYGFDKNTEFQTMNYQNNTFYGLLISDGQWGNYNGIGGQNFSKFDIQNNIWYNSSNEIIRRLAGGRFGSSAPQTFNKNTYIYGGKDNSAKEASYDKSGTILVTDPTFVDAAEGDFTLHAGSQQAKEQTGDPHWFVDYDATKALPVPITVAPEAGAEIAAAVEAAKTTVDKVGDITINLAKDATYTIAASIEAPAAIVINGNKATIDATALAVPFITINGSDIQAKNQDGTENANYKYVENVIIKDVTVKGLAKALVRDEQKTLVAKVNVENSVVEVAENASIFDFNSKGYPAELAVNKSTIWSKEGHTGYFLQSSGRVKDLDGNQVEYKQVISLTNSTLSKISVGKKMNNLNGKGQKSLVLTITNSILSDCTLDGSEINGWLGGQNSLNPVVTYEKNTYWNNGKVQEGWTDSSKQGYDASETSLVTDPTFVNAAEGDFTVGASTQQAQLKTGDPRWLVKFVAPTNVDKTALETEIATAKTLLGDASTEDGTPGATLKTAITDAETALTTAVFQHEIDAAVAALQAAEEAYKTTGIVNIGADANADNGAWYNANGVRVAKPTQKGLYIHNGKKIVIK